jgi:hypothetical protein
MAIERLEGVLVERLLDWDLIVTYPTKYKRSRATLSRHALWGMRPTVRAKEGSEQWSTTLPFAVFATFRLP